ncbi:hypothetical protein M422DRAFT_153255 [Sphaerobolus stellatus SS14]|nr:hypothetical protein M422DRAFT_153255 [Sphaerobolus stellatus SS14]
MSTVSSPANSGPSPIKPILKSSTSGPSSSSSSSIPAKRPMLANPASPLRASPLASVEPPRKLQRVSTVKRAVPTAVAPSTQSSDTGVPTVDVSAGSKIPAASRQACLKPLYEAYVTLYSSFHSYFPHLAREHALAEEIEVYTKTNKLTYRQGMVNTLIAVKKREQPTSPDHKNVGTESEIRAKEKAQKKKVEAADLEDIIMTREQLILWGYIVDVPDGPGGDLPTSEGAEQVCERCQQNFVVKALGDGADEACTYHWARPYTMMANGEKIRTYRCCAMLHPSPGCTQGPHVFYEKKPEELHRRHAFSPSSEPPSTLSEDAVLDVAAIDCEMIYTTGGMHVARVSVVDGEGKKVLDEFVRLPDGVKVIDYITRFSGVTPDLLKSAVLDLHGIRQALRSYIGPSTIIVGHALENDLKTLRMIHHRVVDTCILFPHKGGAPYRRALRDLVSEKLQKMIQANSDSGHSSVEDAIATLDLVRYWIANVKSRRKRKVQTPETPPLSESPFKIVKL